MRTGVAAEREEEEGGVGLARDTPVRVAVAVGAGRSCRMKSRADGLSSSKDEAWTHPRVPSNADSIPETHEIIIRRWFIPSLAEVSCGWVRPPERLARTRRLSLCLPPLPTPAVSSGCSPPASPSRPFSLRRPPFSYYPHGTRQF